MRFYLPMMFYLRHHFGNDFIAGNQKRMKYFSWCMPSTSCKASDPPGLSVGGDNGSQSRDPVPLPLESPGVGLGTWLKRRFLGSSPELLKQQLLRLGPGNLHVTSSLDDSSTCYCHTQPCKNLEFSAWGPLRLSISTSSLYRLEEVRPREGK